MTWWAWGFVGGLTEVSDLEGGPGRPQQVPWPRWDHTEAPVGSMAEGRRGELQGDPSGLWPGELATGRPQQPQYPLPASREV